MRTLPNYQEYMALPEYATLVSLMQKGIAIHHAGVIPVFREVVELLFAKGFVKLLFATETFAVGINMPTRTVIFTDLYKYDGKSKRLLLPHEYTQMAGRAGRRGIDTIGHVLHLNNLFSSSVGTIEYKAMLKGQPQRLESKFNVSYSLIFDTLNGDVSGYCAKSMLHRRLQWDAAAQSLAEAACEEECVKTCDALTACGVREDILTQYNYCVIALKTAVNSAKRKYTLEMQTLLTDYPQLVEAAAAYLKHETSIKSKQRCVASRESNANYLKDQVSGVMTILVDGGFLQENDGEDKDGMMCLTKKGIAASTIKEYHPLIFAELLENSSFLRLSSNEIILLLSCYTSANAYNQFHVPPPVEQNLTQVFCDLAAINEKYFALEERVGICTKRDASQFDMIIPMQQWIVAASLDECRRVLADTGEEGIFTGEFIKAVMKIANMATELDLASDDVELKHRLAEIPAKILKFVAANQSLYI